jgi:hypothetical protein
MNAFFFSESSMSKNVCDAYPAKTAGSHRQVHRRCAAAAGWRGPGTVEQSNSDAGDHAQRQAEQCTPEIAWAQGAIAHIGLNQPDRCDEGAKNTEHHRQNEVAENRKKRTDRLFALHRFFVDSTQDETPAQDVNHRVAQPATLAKTYQVRHG